MGGALAQAWHGVELKTMERGVTVHSTSANGCRNLKLVGLPKGRSEDAGAWVKETDTVL